MYDHPTPARDYFPGMGKSVADRTINRKIDRSIYKVVEFDLWVVDPSTIYDAVVKFATDAGYVLADSEPNSHGHYSIDTVVAPKPIPALTRLLRPGYARRLAEKATFNKWHATGYFIPKSVKAIENWADVAHRVAVGNAMLDPRINTYGSYTEAPVDERLFKDDVFTDHVFKSERFALEHHLRQASLLMSGRHLQHGDENQIKRKLELFTNCFDGSTKILTAEYGPVPIIDVVDKHVTVRAADGKMRPAFIHSHGQQAVFDVVFKPAGGQGHKKTVRVTADHRWFLRNNKETTKLKVGDVIQSSPGETADDREGIVHGIIFGDGTSHKARNNYPGRRASQGKDYVSIRLCSEHDKVLLDLFKDYTVTYPDHANGDPVVYLGRKAFFKDLPFSVDPAYIASFIEGWWLADGSKSPKLTCKEISTTREDAVAWLYDHAAYAGLSITSHRRVHRTEGDGSFENGKTLHVIRLRADTEYRVESIFAAGTAEVFCPEEPVTSGFVLANGLLTGNCSTSITRHRLFELLLNGSGVGTLYADAVCDAADYNFMPIVVPVIEWSHPDVMSGEIRGIPTPKAAEHLYAGRTVVHHRVADSREGWAKAIEIIDGMTFARRVDEVLILDFTDVRHRGSPIKGMQNRPASGPGPLMDAIANVAKLRSAGMAPWRAAMYADHYLAECVLVGGARRAARAAVKPWDDETIFDFIELKRGGHLWSSNNSIGVTAEFWAGVAAVENAIAAGGVEMRNFDSTAWPIFSEIYVGTISDRDLHAWRVFQAATKAAHEDNTGEPGFLNVDMLNDNRSGMEAYLEGSFIDSSRNPVESDVEDLYRELSRIVLALPYPFIVNPCFEIVLLALGGYCTIADVVPFHAQNDDDAEDAFRTAVRALIRVNLMDCLYTKEVKRTNRIGVGMTGLHEWIWNRFRLGFRDIIEADPDRMIKDAHGVLMPAPTPAALKMWRTLSRFARAVSDEASSYSALLGVTVPHTDRTVKPAGTTSKLFGLTEGVHLPPMREYLRWVQYRNDDPLIVDLIASGYPTKQLKQYAGTTIVGFPTRPAICALGMGDKLVTASEATPEEQFRFLRLLELFWIRGVDENDEVLGNDTGNQISYTLKYDPDLVSLSELRAILLDNQSKVKCCAFMPKTDTSAYEYLPESATTKDEYEHIVQAIRAAGGESSKEDIGIEHVDCSSGACPIDVRDEKIKAA